MLDSSNIDSQPTASILDADKNIVLGPIGLGGMDLAGEYELARQRQEELEKLRQKSLLDGSADVYG